MMRTSVRLTYGEDLQIDWDGHGELLVKVLFLTFFLSALFLSFHYLLSHPNMYRNFLV